MITVDIILKQETTLQMYLYNVSFNLNNTNNVLIPSIPESAANDEDKSTKRVCLCDTVEHCMQAIAVGNRCIKAGAQFILRVADIPKTNKRLIKPLALKQCNKVPDALENNEYWYLDKLTFKVYKCVINSFDYNRDIAWTCLTAEQVRHTVYGICNKIKLERYTISKSVYKAIMDYAHRHKLYGLEDDIWDAIVELPWAQKTIIYNLNISVIEEIIQK